MQSNSVIEEKNDVTFFQFVPLEPEDKCDWFGIQRPLYREIIQIAQVNEMSKTVELIQELCETEELEPCCCESHQNCNNEIEAVDRIQETSLRKTTSDELQEPMHEIDETAIKSPDTDHHTTSYQSNALEKVE
ncbi:hypothetical protein M3Y95_01198200 [Aphelenchoides besseyi]|nr:hypothetical protein M3Y95_01198200 [Aphelenchoides besseyi]